MRKFSAALLAFLAIPFCLLRPYLAANAATPTVAVYADRGSENLGAATQLADILANKIVDKGTLTVIDRQHTNAILSEQATSSAGQVTPATEAQLGRMLGVNYLIVVRIESLTASSEERQDVLSILSKQASYVTKLSLDDSLSVVDVRSAQVVQTLEDQQSTTSAPSASASNQGFVDEAVTTLLKTSATALAPKLDTSKLGGSGTATEISGRILDVSGDDVTLSLGSQSGVQVGQLIDEFASKSVLNPDTGKTIQTLIKQGTLQITQVEADYSIAKPLAGGHPVKFLIVRPAAQ